MSEPAVSNSAVAVPEQITNSIGIPLIRIPAGAFMMGASEREADSNERPRHRVQITKDFYLARHPVTQKEWQSIMGGSPAHFTGRGDLPVEQVTYHDAIDFLQTLSQREGEEYRLPTEAEWEYAARAGTASRYYWGDGIDPAYCWFAANSGMKTHPVGARKPNGWGLHDMLGNVWEWCQDWYGADYYAESPESDPAGPSSGEYRTLRGGSWYYQPKYLRASYRGYYAPDYSNSYLGFRIVRVVR